MKEKNKFSGRLGFVLAAAGSAVGLGNLWRFPYLAAQYGGETFIAAYIIISVTFGFTLMITEIAIGRRTGKSAIDAFTALNKKWGFIGVLCIIVNVLILSFYSVVGGWVAKYFLAFISGNGAEAAADYYFKGFISGNAQPFLLTGVFILLIVSVVTLGVKKGIEKISKILMPGLIIMLIAVAVYIMTIPGAMGGVHYYFTPHNDDFTFEAVLAAMSQVFFSMSLAMGVLVTYGSYMSKKDNILHSAHQIELFDIGVSILAGLIVVPAIFAVSGGDAHAVGAGPELLFVTLPKIFVKMGRIGGFVGALFFLLVFCAAVTSCISLFEVPVSAMCDKFKITRKKACFILAGVTAVTSSLCTMGYGVLSGFSFNGKTIFDTFDFAASNVLMPVIAILTCILIGHILSPGIITEEIETTGTHKSKHIYRVMIKYIVPVMVAAILITGILDSFGVIGN